MISGSQQSSASGVFKGELIFWRNDMSSVFRLFTIVLAVGCALLWLDEFAFAEPTTAQQTGSVTGTVFKDGKPVANARVGLATAPDKSLRKKAKALSKHPAASSANAPATQPSAGSTRKHERHQALVKGTTDADGKF